MTTLIYHLPNKTSETQSKEEDICMYHESERENAGKTKAKHIKLRIIETKNNVNSCCVVHHDAYEL